MSEPTTKAERRELFARAFKRMNDLKFPRAEYYLLLHLWADAERRERNERFGEFVEALELNRAARLAVESTRRKHEEANQEKNAA